MPGVSNPTLSAKCKQIPARFKAAERRWSDMPTSFVSDTSRRTIAGTVIDLVRTNRLEPQLEKSTFPARAPIIY